MSLLLTTHIDIFEINNYGLATIACVKVESPVNLRRGILKVWAQSYVRTLQNDTRKTWSTALRTTVDNDGILYKEATSYNDIFDAFRLALKFYNFEGSSEY